MLSDKIGERGDAAGGRYGRGSRKRAESRVSSAAVTWVVLSPVSRLPYWSST